LIEKPFIVIASYPKSGNTWTRIVLDHMIAGTADLDLTSLSMALYGKSRRQVFDQLSPAPASSLRHDEIDALLPEVLRYYAKDLERYQLIKTHALPIGQHGDFWFPPELVAGVVHLVRHPFDVVLSYANHRAKSLDNTIKLMVKDDAWGWANKTELGTGLHELMGSWRTHAEDWSAELPMPSITIRYEDLLADPTTHFAQMLDMVGMTYDPDLLDEVIAATRFEKLREREERDGFREKPEKSRAFFNSGRAGRGASELSKDQKRRFEEAHAMMRKFGYATE